MWFIMLRVLLIFGIVTNIFGIPINNDENKLGNAINHCTNLCKTCYGEPHFDKLEEKCYCLMRKFNGSNSEDIECRETMKTNAKVFDINLIIDDSIESKIRVPRSDNEASSDDITVTTAPRFLNFTDSAHTTIGGDLEKATPDQQQSTTQSSDIVGESNPNMIALESQVNEVVELQSVDAETSKNRGKVTAITKKSSPVTLQSVQDLVQETKQRFNEFVARHQSGDQSVKEAQTSIKDIQARLLQMANRIRATKPETPVQEATPKATVTLQEKIRELTAKLRATAGKQKVSATETDQVVEESNPSEVVAEEEEEADPVVGQARRHLHRRRRPLRRHRHRTPTPEVHEHHHEHHHIENPEVVHHESEIHAAEARERAHASEIETRNRERAHEAEIEARTRHRHRNIDDIPRRHRIIPRRHRERLEARQSAAQPIVQPPDTIHDENATNSPPTTEEFVEEQSTTTELPPAAEVSEIDNNLEN